MFKVNNTHEFISAPTITNIWFAWLIAVAYFVRGARTYQKLYMKMVGNRSIMKMVGNRSIMKMVGNRSIMKMVGNRSIIR